MRLVSVVVSLSASLALAGCLEPLVSSEPGASVNILAPGSNVPHVSKNADFTRQIRVNDGLSDSALMDAGGVVKLKSGFAAGVPVSYWDFGTAPEIGGLLYRLVERNADDAVTPIDHPYIANALPGDREACLAAGMDAFISKPVDPHSLAITLGRWVSTTGPDGGAPVGATTHEHVGVLDQSRLDMIRTLEPGGAALLERTITSFLDASPDNLERVSEAIAAGSAEALVHAAHRLKGSALNLGLPRVAAVCDELEALGAARDLDPAPAALERLSRELDLASSALRAHDRLPGA